MIAALDLAPWADHCTSCGAAIVWATTSRGAAIPINPAPGDGNVALAVQYDIEGGEQLVAVVLNHEQLSSARARGATLYAAHFADCPHADRHRKERRR